MATTLEQEITIQRDTTIRSAIETIAVQLEDIADVIENHNPDCYGHREIATVLRMDATALREREEAREYAADMITTAEEYLTEMTGHYAVSIPESGTWYIVTEAGLALLDDREA